MGLSVHSKNTAQHWCGPCKAIVSSFKRIKNELGDDLLVFATAETDSIDSLEAYRMKSQPTFLFYAGGILVNALRGCNCPLLIKTICSELREIQTRIQLCSKDCYQRKD